LAKDVAKAIVKALPPSPNVQAPNYRLIFFQISLAIFMTLALIA
jgi:hypothetical protein